MLSCRLLSVFIQISETCIAEPRTGNLRNGGKYFTQCTVSVCFCSLDLGEGGVEGTEPFVF